MFARKRSSKSKKRIPNKYENTVCDLNKKKGVMDEELKDHDESRVSGGVFGDKGEKDGTKCSNDSGDEIGDYCDEIWANYVEIRSNCGDCNSDSYDVNSEKNHIVEDDMVKQNIDNGIVSCGNDDDGKTGKNEEMLVAEKIDDTVVSDTQPNKFNGVLSNKATYSSMTSNNVLINRNLDYEPTLTEGDSEFVIFYEGLVNHGSLKWKFTICGHFVSMKMPYNELKYNLVRMWSKFGLTKMFSNDSEVPDVNLDKHEPDKIPLWVKMFDIPLEAWNKKGISKLTSSLGKPLVMDEMTANMSQYGRGRIGFARVLVEVDARKKFKEGIDVQYRDSKGSIKRPKSIEEMEQMDKGNEREQQPKDKFSEVNIRKQQQNNVSKQNQQTNFGRRNYGANIAGSRKTLNVEKFSYKPKSPNKFVALGEGVADNIGNRLNKDHKKEEEMINKVMTDDDEKDVIEVLSGKGIMENEIEGMEDSNTSVHHFVYAANHGKERIGLWKDLDNQTQFVNGRPWILLGDFNVTLHS
ncbi:RNA-directed DNA polymerase, eukaryota, reverse transcriptase zinc-binding domain protein, partial [Tanacetum coccineum]